MKKLSIIFFILLINFTPRLSICDITLNGDFLLTIDGYLGRYEIIDGQLKQVEIILQDSDIYSVYWPSTTDRDGVLYFESRYSSSSIPTIFSYDIKSKGSKIIKIIEGRFPSVSPDGRFLTYYSHPNSLYFINMMNKSTNKVSSDFLKYRPAVWASSKKIIYTNNQKEMLTFDINTKKASKTGHKSIIPVVMSPDYQNILCISYNGKKILQYNLRENDLKVFKEMKYLKFGGSFVWDQDGSGFLFSRQTWPSQLRLRETHDLFFYSVGGNEFHLMNNKSLAGGISVSRNQ